MLLGSFAVSIAAAAIAATGFIFATVYALWMLWQVFFCPRRTTGDIADLSVREMLPLVVAVGLLIWIGLFPQSVIRTARQGLETLKATIEWHKPTRRSIGAPDKGMVDLKTQTAHKGLSGGYDGKP